MRLPQRYDAGYRAAVMDAIHGTSDATAARVLDVGGGRRPFFRLSDRPFGWTYAGLDISRAELLAAQAGSYDEIYVSDVESYDARLEASFDLIVSCWMFEHVGSLEVALLNMRQYLRPGGALVALFSGKFGAHSLAKRILPTRIERALLTRYCGRDEDSVFPAVYDNCWYGRLQRMSHGWRIYEVLPLYWGAGYFTLAAPLQWAYLKYENWAERTQRFNLATHYLLTAKRAGTTSARHLVPTEND